MTHRTIRLCAAIMRRRGPRASPWETLAAAARQRRAACPRTARAGAAPCEDPGAATGVCADGERGAEGVPVPHERGLLRQRRRLLPTLPRRGRSQQGAGLRHAGRRAGRLPVLHRRGHDLPGRPLLRPHGHRRRVLRAAVQHRSRLQRRSLRGREPDRVLRVQRRHLLRARHELEHRIVVRRGGCRRRHLSGQRLRPWHRRRAGGSAPMQAARAGRRRPAVAPRRSATAVAARSGSACACRHLRRPRPRRRPGVRVPLERRLPGQQRVLPALARRRGRRLPGAGLRGPGRRPRRIPVLRRRGHDLPGDLCCVHMDSGGEYCALPCTTDADCHGGHCTAGSAVALFGCGSGTRTAGREGVARSLMGARIDGSLLAQRCAHVSSAHGHANRSPSGRTCGPRVDDSRAAEPRADPGAGARAGAGRGVPALLPPARGEARAHGVGAQRRSRAC